MKTLDEVRQQTASLTHSLMPMERFWPSLSEEHRQDLVCLARRWAAQDRVVKRSGDGLDRSESSLAATS